MKNILLLLTIFATLTSNAQNIKQGDNLKAEFKKLDKPFYFEAPSFTGWTEGSKMLLIGSNPNLNDCDFLFIALKDTTLIGIFKISKPNVFMFDTEGNSILSKTYDFFFLPIWIVKNKTRIVSSDKIVFKVLDKLYEQTMQANDGQPDETTIRQYQQFKTDTTLANRHLVLLFDTYQTIVTETAAKGEKLPIDICVPLMNTLAGECITVYNKIPAIVCIYMGEALESAGMLNEARKHFKMSLQFYPNSIPLLVYNYRLEQDLTKKKEIFKTLDGKRLIESSSIKTNIVHCLSVCCGDKMPQINLS